MLVGSLAVAGGLLYFWKRSQASQTDSPVSAPSNYQPAQPSQTYPWSAIFAPRVDNKNQPWAAGAMSGIAGAMKQDISSNPLGSIQAGASVVHSLSDVWGQLTGASTSGTSGSDLTVDSTDNPITSDTSYMSDQSLAGDGMDQSNLVGDQFSQDLAS